MLKEIWRPVSGYESRYEVSNLGRVRICGIDAIGRSRYQGHVLSPAFTGVYQFVCLSGKEHSEGKRPKNMTIHSLVAAAFIGPRPEGLVINHKDGNRLNNVVENLEYCTYSENYRHALDVLGFQPPRGEGHWKAKLSEDDVIQMRRARAGGMSVKEIAAARSLPMGYVSNVTTGKLWKHVVPHSYLEA